MIARTAASIVIAAGLALGATGCTFLAPQATLIHYEPSDGVATTIGEIKARNVVAISDDGTEASLVFDLVNSGTDAELVNVQYTDATGAKQTSTVYAAPGTNPVGYGDGPKITMTDIDAKVGGLFPVYLQYGDKQGKGMTVPVLDGTQSQFATFVPTPSPTATK